MLTIHVIADNYATHKRVKTWLTKQPRFQLHFTPTRSSWLNLVERFCEELTADRIRDGSFQNVGQLADSIMTYLAERNETPNGTCGKLKVKNSRRRSSAPSTRSPPLLQAN